MLHWLSLLVLAASRATFADPSQESEELGDVLYQCHGRAWVRAPDMVPGDVIAGDVKVKLNGPCTNAESYMLGLRYKERIVWKLRQQDAPLPKKPKIKSYKHKIADSTPDWVKARMLDLAAHRNPEYSQTEWMTYQESFEDKDLWTVHEEERVAFEIKTNLAGVDGADPLPTSFTAGFGILVPNTNYPPGLDYRQGGGGMFSPWGMTDEIHSESIYEYFVEIKFSNGTTSEIPAGMTTFAPFYLLTKNDILPENLSVARTHYEPVLGPEPLVDMLQSNYTIEISFPDGTQVHQNSSVNIMATVHRTGYTNRTDTPTELCAYMNRPNTVEWHSQELKNRSLMPPFVTALVPSSQKWRRFSDSASPCREVKFAAIPDDETQEGRISSTSSEPLLLPLYVEHSVVPDFSTYYFKLENRALLDLQIRPDPSEPWEYEFQRERWKKQVAGMDESDFDWVPWLPLIHERRVFYEGNTSISVIPMHWQQQGHLRSTTPVHYLSGEARQPVFVNFSDIAVLRSMSLEERDLTAPLAQPYTKVFAKGEELYSRYFASRMGDREERPIYVGDTWINKVLSVTAEGQRDTENVESLLVVQ